MPPFAHSSPSGGAWEPLFTSLGAGEQACMGMECEACLRLKPDHGHLNKVAYWCADFAAAMFPTGEDRQTTWHWGYLAGLWHDLGKFPSEWQDYLRSKADPHLGEISGRMDHSTAGACHAVQAGGVTGHLLAYIIAGHHSGLLDGTSNGSCQASRLEKVIDLSEIPDELSQIPFAEFPPFLKKRDAYPFAFFTRMLFSCLVDADFLATEAFMNPDQAALRNEIPEDILASMARLVTAKIDSFGSPAPGDSVAAQRRLVVESCKDSAGSPPGLFSLTVPTGGGKTLSSLLFALLHAVRHGQRRIIYVVPFTSIIEQNADVIRQIIEPLRTERFTPLIEHHSSLSPEKETTLSRLASENWDAPIVITTAVQFYESLHAAKTSRCRKLHRIANSVVILDEAQTLPVDFLAPSLRVLRELTAHYHTTAVLCTATQPAVHYNEEEFPIGLKDCREIIPDPQALFAALKRVEVGYLGELPDTELASRLKAHRQVLCIVNRRRHAREIFELLEKDEGNRHLSALMCPEHRSLVLADIRQRLAAGLPVRAVSTQLIEAGVDVDFPVVYRALAGLDSIAQAAGRCNRNGKLPGPGQVHVFRPKNQGGERYFRDTAQVAYELIGLHEDLLGQEAIHHYFDLYYYRQKIRWDAQGILPAFRLDGGNRALPFAFQFSSVADAFRLIEERQVPVIIPFDEKAKKLVADLRNPEIPLHRQLMRGLQRYTVQIPPSARDLNLRSLEVLRNGEFHVLVSTDLNYSADFGLALDEGHASAQNLIL